MLSELSEGALEKIMSGEEFDQPIFQFLAHRALDSGKRYRLLISDGIKSSSFTMLSPKLNTLITSGVLLELSIFQIKRYVISTVSNCGILRRVIVILDMEVLVSGPEVGQVLGSVYLTTAKNEVGSDAACQASAAPPPRPVRNQQVAPKPSSRPGKIHSIHLALIVIVVIITLSLLQFMHSII